MEEAAPAQVFVRNDKGQVWGPLQLPTVEMLVENGLITGQVQISKDGVKFAFPGRFPEFREFFPRHLWGDGAAAAAAPSEPAAAAQVITLGADPEPSSAEPAQPVAASVPAAGPGAAPMAGPGARAAAQARSAPRGPPPPGPRHAPKPAAAAPPKVAPPIAPSVAPIAPPVAPMAPPPPAPAAAAPIAAPSAPGEPVPPSGDLSKVSPIHLYYLAAAGDHTVQIAFRLPDRVITVHFRRGNPEYVGSSHPEDSVETFLTKRGLATAAQLAQAEEAKGRFGGEVLGALFGLGILNAGSAFAQLAQRAQGILLKAMVAESGTFTAEPKELLAQSAMPLGNRWAVLSETVRKIPGPDLRRRLQAVFDLPVMKSGGRVQTQDLRLIPQETRALAYIDGVRSLAQLVKDLPQEADHLVRMAFFLQELEAVSFAAVPARPEPARPPEAPRPEPAPKRAPTAKPAGASGPKPAPSTGPKPAASAAAPRPAPPRPSEPPKPPAAPAPSPEEELKQLRNQAAGLKKQNLFQILGLAEKADGAAVKIAYFKLARVYHPDTVPPGAPEELSKLKSEIFAAIGEAYRRLSDDKGRAEYLEDLKGGGGDKVDVQQLLLAEELFQKGCILVKARKFADAVKMLDDAIKANDKEGEFYAWRGYARFFTVKDDKAKARAEAQQDFNVALKLNERVGSLHYFMGQVCKLSGDAATALKHFKKALEYQPEHLEAQREVRMAGAKH